MDKAISKDKLVTVVAPLLRLLKKKDRYKPEVDDLTAPFMFTGKLPKSITGKDRAPIPEVYEFLEKNGTPMTAEEIERFRSKIYHAFASDWLCERCPGLSECPVQGLQARMTLKDFSNAPVLRYGDCSYKQLKIEAMRDAPAAPSRTRRRPPEISSTPTKNRR